MDELDADPALEVLRSTEAPSLIHLATAAFARAVAADRAERREEAAKARAASRARARPIPGSAAEHGEDGDVREVDDENGAAGGAGSSAADESDDEGVSLADMAADLPAHLAQRLLTALIREGMPIDSATWRACFEPRGHEVTGVDISTLRPGASLSLLELSSIGDWCPSLRVLKANALEVSEAQLAALLSQLRGLEAVSLRHADCLRDDVLCMLGRQNAHTLRSLDLSWSAPDMWDAGVLQLLHCERLEVLRLNGMSRITSDVLEPVLTSTTALRSLALKGCSSVDSLLVNLPCLTEIDLGGMPHLPVRDIQRLLCANAAALAAVRLVESNVTPAALDAVVHAAGGVLPHLKVLDLSWCDELTAAATVRFVTACPALEDVRLRRSTIGDAEVEAIASSCPQLARVTLPRCDGIGNPGATSLAKHCPRLWEVDLSWAATFDNAGLAALVGALDLRVLTLQGCKALTEELATVVTEGKHSWALRHLDLGWINAVDDTVVERLLDAVPGLVVVDYYVNDRSRDTAK